MSLIDTDVHPLPAPRPSFLSHFPYPPPILSDFRSTLLIPPRKPLSTWAEENIILSPEYSNSTGPLRLFGWQREIFDAVTDPSINEIVIMSSTQVVKCLSENTPIPTPEGWKFLGHIKTGDLVFDEHGSPCQVTGVSETHFNKDCYQLTFDDGEQITTDISHVWRVHDWHQREQVSRLMTTEEMYLGMKKRGGKKYGSKSGTFRNPYRIDCCGALKLPETELPIDPYIFGCWLGDGTTSSSAITVDLRDGLFNELRKVDPGVRIIGLQRGTKHLASVKCGKKFEKGGKWSDTMQGKLRELGVLGDKHIPKMYLRASEEQRRALLQGLLDTDGTVGKQAHSSMIVLILSCRLLARHAVELARSLGLKPKFKVSRASLNGQDAGETYIVSFTAYREDAPFRLQRKLDRLSWSTEPHCRPTEARRRSIVSIEPIPSVPVKCLSVDSRSHLYLAGRSMIPTHNSIALMCAIVYWIVEDPGPILLVEPKDDAARQFSKRRLTPLARDCRVLHGRISDSTHDGRNTILSKDFPGGNLLIVSARTPTDLAQHTIRYLVCDEVDKYTADVGGSAEKGGEGDPIDLAWERAMTFGSRRKRIIACSPTVAGISRISKAFARSDQRRPYVPCPKCGTKQILCLREKKMYRVRWDSGLSKDLAPATAHYHCIKCDHPWTELERWHAANHLVEWRADFPERTSAGIAGFWINHFYVPFTWKTTADITRQFLNAKDDRQSLKTFINTTLAEEWQEEGEVPEKQVLYARRETYPFNESAVIPQRGLFLTAAVDVQDNPPRLEVEVKAWGRGRENWSMGYWVIQVRAENGQELPVTSHELWDKLDADILQRDWLHESGHTLPILVMGIDTGKTPKPVYEFARKHPQLHYGPSGIRLVSARTVVPTKGTDDALRIIAGISKEDAARKRQGVRIVSIGTHCAKGEIFDLLRHAVPKPDGMTLSGEFVHGCYHFPMYDMVYFDGLTAEVKVVDVRGNVTYEKRAPRNEQLDTSVITRAAAAIVGIDRFGEAQWRQLEEAVKPMSLTGGERGVAQREEAESTHRSASVPALPLTSTPQGVSQGDAPSVNVSQALPTTPQPVRPKQPDVQGPGPMVRPVRGSFL